MEENNVIPFRKEKKVEGRTSHGKDGEVSSFADVIQKNLETKERLKQERLKANQSVLRSYRLKK